MKEQFEFMLWAVAYIAAWFVLMNLLDLDDWVKALFRKRRTSSKLTAKLAALERRVAELERRP